MLSRSALSRLRANLFPAALPAVENWQAFPWHCGAAGEVDTWKPHSSQALAIDVFGTLKVSPARDAILDALAGQWGVETGGSWELALEWLDPENGLREKRRSQVDAVARSAANLVFFECKFTENEAGACSQPRPCQGVRQCSGSYAWQTNPHNGIEARCALAGKGIRYWEYIPQVFRLAAEVDYHPCPFAGAWYQWMRNLVACQAVAQRLGLRPVFVIVYAEGPFAIAEELHSKVWKDFLVLLRPGVVTLRWMSYQELIEAAQRAVGSAAGDTWHKLAAWVGRKIANPPR